MGEVVDAIAKVEPVPVALTVSQRTAALREALQEEAETRKVLAEYIRGQMVEDVDFGIIPGTKDRTLLKPGAEKLISLFRVEPDVVILRAVEDYDQPLISFVIQVKLKSVEGRVVASGLGSANSREGKWRWRNATRKCPACGKEAIIKGKEEYGGGWLCFAKKGGCGAKFKAGDKGVEDQSVGQSENEDIATLANTILKVAEKRAKVNAAIALGRCSDLFTQDMESEPSPSTNEQRPPTAKPTSAGGKPQADLTHWRAALALATAAGWTAEKLKDLLKNAHGVESAGGVTPEIVEAIRKYLKPPAVTDVADGETEEEAIARTTGANYALALALAEKLGWDKTRTVAWLKDVHSVTERKHVTEKVLANLRVKVEQATTSKDVGIGHGAGDDTGHPDEDAPL